MEHPALLVNALHDGESDTRFTHPPSSPKVHPGLRAFASTNDGRLTIELVREFLAYFELSCTDNVLVSEAGQQNAKPVNRQAIGAALAVVR